jgi:thiamine biosynthesis lipoprotein
MHYDQFRAMNSDIVLAASGPDASLIKQGFSLARLFFQLSEQRFTRFTDTSELAMLNRSAGSWFHASDEMYMLIERALDMALETGGIFNPAILPALKMAGYDRSMDLIRTSASRVSPVRVVEIDDFRQVQLDAGYKSIYLPGGMQVDLGGIAKGWIAERAAEQLLHYSSACAASAGGDMFMINLPQGQSDWEVGLEDPLEPEQDLAVLHIQPGGLATSSTAKRKWVHNGKQQHHLIDPRTGLPAETDWISVTVWAQTAVQAEIYSKVLLILGSQDANLFIKDKASMAYLAVDQKGWVVGSDNYHEVFHV